MRGFFLSLAGVITAAGTAFYIFALCHPDAVATYQAAVRAPVFTAFITLGSFLLTLKTALLQRLKDGFDCKEHREAYIANRKNGVDGTYYESLSNISIAIATCVPMALTTSVLQLTLGFYPTPEAFAVCAAFPTATIALVLYMWYQMSSAHRFWIDLIEEQKEKELAPRFGKCDDLDSPESEHPISNSSPNSD